MKFIYNRIKRIPKKIKREGSKGHTVAKVIYKEEQFLSCTLTHANPSSFGLNYKGVYFKDNVTIKTQIMKNTHFLVEN